MRFFRKSSIGLLLLSISLGLIAYAGHMVSTALDERMAKPARKAKQRERVFAVNVVAAEAKTEIPMLSAFGEIQSRRTLDLRLGTAGQVAYVSDNFVEGGQVQAGELLLRLDEANARSELARAEADLQDARIEADQALRALGLVQDELTAAVDQADLRRRAFERQADLKQRGVGTASAVESAEIASSSASQAVLSRRSALDQAELRRDQASTRLDRAQLMLEDAQRRLQDTSLFAEFPGTLSGIRLVQGGLVSPNEKLGSLIDPGRLEVAFRISTAQYARLIDDEGRLLAAPVLVSLSSSGGDLTSKAVLSRDSGSVGDGLTGRVVFATLADPRGLKPGDFVTIEVEEPELPYVIRLPASAVDAAGRVLVLEEDDRLGSLEVRVLRRQGDDVLVRSRALSGREVVAQRSPVLGAGIKVKPLRAADGTQIEEPALVELTSDRRAKLMAYIEGNGYIPADAKKRILTQLQQEKVPAQVVERIESRMGG